MNPSQFAEHLCQSIVPAVQQLREFRNCRLATSALEHVVKKLQQPEKYLEKPNAEICRQFQSLAPWAQRAAEEAIAGNVEEALIEIATLGSGLVELMDE